MVIVNEPSYGCKPKALYIEVAELVGNRLRDRNPKVEHATERAGLLALARSTRPKVTIARSHILEVTRSACCCSSWMNTRKPSVDILVYVAELADEVHSFHIASKYNAIAVLMDPAYSAARGCRWLHEALQVTPIYAVVVILILSIKGLICCVR